MPGLPLLFTGTGGTTEFNYHPLPGLYLGEDTFLGEGIWLDEGISEAFAASPALAQEGIFETVTPVPAEAFMPVPGLPTFGQVTEIVSPVPAVAFMQVPGFGGQERIETVTPVPAVAFMPVPGTSGAIPFVIIPSVRELPPLRIHIDVHTPAGKYFRWGTDEPDPANVPAGIRFSDTMPGGFETFDCTLPRKNGREGADLEPFSTIRALGAGGESVWEGRLERAPRSSGDQVAVSPSAVGYQAALDDDKSATAVYVDRDVGRWQEPTTTRRLVLSGANTSVGSAGTANDFVQPALMLSYQGGWSTPSGMTAEAVYLGPSGVTVDLVFCEWEANGSVNAADANWQARVFSTTDGNDFNDASADLLVANTGQIIYTPASPRRGAIAQLKYVAGPIASDGVDYQMFWKKLAAYGRHGVQRREQFGDAYGVWASDVVAHAVKRWAPELNVSTTSIGASGFIIPHLVFLEPTTAGEIVKQASRFGLQDWAVWDDRTFWWHDRGDNSRHWRTRVGPAQLEETGPTADRVYESVVVQYQDVDGSAKTAGPPGSGADTESSTLKDLDPDNPANKVGIVRRALLTGLGTSTPAGAVEIGRRFLEEQKLLDSSGRARIVGHVESNSGVTFPYWAPRAGDTVSFIDASDSSPRRIVRTDKDHSSRTCSIDLDAPPEGLQALLERLGVALVPLGFS